MATVVDLLRHLGKADGLPDGNALVGPLDLPPYATASMPLHAPAELSKAWMRVVGRPTEAHHALALAAVRAGETVALMGHGTVPHDDLLLLVLAKLLAEPRGSALWLVPDSTVLAQTQARLQTLKPLVHWQTLAQTAQRRSGAQLTLLTYDELHHRVLQFADRGWRWLWPALRTVALPAIETAAGATGGHLQWLLRRMERLAGELQLLVALAPVAAADTMLPRLIERPARLIAAGSGPMTSTLVCLWHTDEQRQATVKHLAGELAKHRLALTVLGRDDGENAALRASLPPTIAVGAKPHEARVALVMGVPPSMAARQQLLRAGYRLLVLLAGDTPHEHLFAAQPDLLLDCLPGWPLPRANASINAAELACAANEQPLTADEIDGWQVGEQVARLTTQGVLQKLVADDAWQPTAHATELYERLDPRTARGNARTVTSGDGDEVATPPVIERWAIPGAVWRPGLRVAERTPTEIVLERDDEPRRATWPLEHIEAELRDELASRTLAWKERKVIVRRVKVHVQARTRALLELRPDHPPRELPVQRTAERQWTGVALVLETPMPLGHVAPGWALAQTLPLVALAQPTALVPWYDRAQGRLLLIEAEVGGVGLAEVLYAQMERWLDLAQQLAGACATQGLYAPLAKSEHQWLRELRRQPQIAPTAPPAAAQASPAPARRNVPANVPAASAARPTQLVATTKSPPSEASGPRPRVYAVRAAKVYAQPTPAPRLVEQPTLSKSRAYDVPPLPQPKPQPLPAPVVLANDDQHVAEDVQAAVQQPLPAPSVPVAEETEQTRSHAEAFRPSVAAHVAPRPPSNALPPYLAASNKPDTRVSAAEGDGSAPVQAAQTGEAQAAMPEQSAPDVGVSSDKIVPETPADDEQQAMVDEDEQALAAPVMQPNSNAANLLADDDITWDVMLPVDEIDDVSWEPELRAIPDDVPDTTLLDDPTLQVPDTTLLDDLALHTPDTTLLDAPPPRPQPTTQRGRPQPPRYPPPRLPRTQPQAPRPTQATPPARPPAPQQGRTDAKPSQQRQANNTPPHAQPQGQPVRTGPPQPPIPPTPSREQTPRQPALTPEPPPAPPDVGGMIARMRALRAERESVPSAPSRPSQATDEPVEPRFTVGQRVHCVPYGDGIVRQTRSVAGREQLEVEFADGTLLPIDPVISLVRPLQTAAPTRAEDDEI